MAVHKIKAKEDSREDETPEKKSKKLISVSDSKTEVKAKKKTEKPDQPAKHHNPLVRFLLWLTTPLRALGRYFRDSWRELRLVQWPTRKFTWKMTLAVIAYVALFAVLIGLLDLLFTLFFSNFINH